jgi:hypothetical protein
LKATGRKKPSIGAVDLFKNPFYGRRRLSCMGNFDNIGYGKG